MMILLSKIAAAPPLSALLLVNVIIECPENVMLALLKVQIALAEDSSYLSDVHDTVFSLYVTSTLSLKVTVE